MREVLVQNVAQIKNAVKNSLRGTVGQNVLSLYGLQFANYVFPVITIPYLTRVLGPEGWGLVAFTQAFSQYLMFVIDYGFNFSATREVARLRCAREHLAELFAGVLAAKALLAFLALGVAFIASHWISTFHENPAVFWAGVFWALAMAFNLTWYFQGLERMRLVAAIDFSAKALATVGIFLVVRNPDDAWLVLVLQGTAALFSLTLGLQFAWRELPLRWPRVTATLKTLRLGWNLFLLRAALSCCATGNTFILGLFAPVQSVAYYAGAEKVLRVLWAPVGPISQSFYPRLSRLVQEDRTRAGLEARLLAILFIALGLLLAGCLFIAAPWIIRVIFGPGFDPAVTALRVLAWAPPLSGLGVLGLLWMVPLGLDRFYMKIVLLGALANLGIALSLARPMAHVGMAVAALVSEGVVGCGVYLALRRREQLPWSGRFAWQTHLPANRTR